MRWSINRERTDATVGGSQCKNNYSSPRRSSCSSTDEKTDVSSDKELIESSPSTHSNRDEGRRRFALFRRRRGELCVEDGENQRIGSESDQGNSPHVETSVAAVEDASLLNCSDEDLNNNKVDEGNREDDKSTCIKEGDSSAKFHWFGLLSKNDHTTSSSCEENERGCESFVEQQTSAVKDSDEQLNRVNSDAADINEADSGVLQHDTCVSTKEVRIDSTKPRFSWFGLLQPPLQSAPSCMEKDSSEILHDKDEHRLVKGDDEGEDKEEAGEDECDEKEGSGDDDNIVYSDDRCSRYANGKESSAEVLNGENSPENSMNTDDNVQGIRDDEDRLQTLFEGSAQDQQEEQQHPCCEDDLQCDASSSVINNDTTESECFVKKNTPLGDEILALWRRRQRLKRKLQIDGPVPETSAPASMKMLGTSQIEVGGGRNGENLRALELEAHLIDTNSDEKMTKMDIMSAEEKAQEDLLYDIFLQDCLLMAGEEPLDGYDNLGWYSITTTREDGEADLEYMNTSTMDVATEEDAIVNKSNRWLDGIGNAALFIFAPDLYLIQQMNETSLQQPKYLPTSNKEDGEKDTGQELGWFGKLFTNGRRLKEDVDFSQVPS